MNVRLPSSPLIVSFTNVAVSGRPDSRTDTVARQGVPAVSARGLVRSEAAMRPLAGAAEPAVVRARAARTTPANRSIEAPTPPLAVRFRPVRRLKRCAPSSSTLPGRRSAARLRLPSRGSSTRPPRSHPRRARSSAAPMPCPRSGSCPLRRAPARASPGGFATLGLAGGSVLRRRPLALAPLDRGGRGWAGNRARQHAGGHGRPAGVGTLFRATVEPIARSDPDRDGRRRPHLGRARGGRLRRQSGARSPLRPADRRCVLRFPPGAAARGRSAPAGRRDRSSMRRWRPRCWSCRSGWWPATSTSCPISRRRSG